MQACDLRSTPHDSSPHSLEGSPTARARACRWQRTGARARARYEAIGETSACAPVFSIRRTCRVRLTPGFASEGAIVTATAFAGGGLMQTFDLRSTPHDSSPHSLEGSPTARARACRWQRAGARGKRATQIAAPQTALPPDVLRAS